MAQNLGGTSTYDDENTSIRHGNRFIGAANELRVNVFNVEEEHLHNFSRNRTEYNLDLQPSSLLSHGRSVVTHDRNYETHIGCNSS